MASIGSNRDRCEMLVPRCPCAADEATKIARLKDLICNQLPRPNRFAFQHMVRCLYEITQNEQYTKLNATTLSVVFAPNVLKNGDPNANPFDTKCYEVINAIFKEVRSLFAGAK